MTAQELLASIKEKLDSRNLATPEINITDIEKKLIGGTFITVDKLCDKKINDKPGIYCIQLRNDVALPEKYGNVRDDRIIYIGIASKSLRTRLWKQELNHKQPATFFRSIGAMLGYLPPQGSLANKDTRNYNLVKMIQILFVNGCNNLY